MHKCIKQNKVTFVNNYIILLILYQIDSYIKIMYLNIIIIDNLKFD